ncbi:hypothetical protein N7466_001129 [Penicillium verhagenii]|uniref:uncharacterized protein n=1 Tax=Penicillium verhagenii TaxID=1562060 RepID=UPI002544DED6|nr:uncharacterized protein N7466_001129 [Penicillium verhagenii]KAJ5948114.1 hypothetical protein N7466_001129 [Penicillium verhagenii]
MSDYPTLKTPIQTVGLREVCEVNGRTFTRRKGADEWTEYIASQSPSDRGPSSHSPPIIYLSLIHYIQGEGEPLHWSLFFARENQPGYEYQVKGDAEHMTYEPSDGMVDVVNADDFLNIYHLAAMVPTQESVVRFVAEEEVPPRAVNRKAVVENCQGWCVRVIATLVTMGIIPETKLQMARSMLQPI